MGEDAWLEAAYEDRFASTDDFYTYGDGGMSAEDDEEPEGPFVGMCDGCETRTEQQVWRVSGSWGTTLVCTHHAHHLDA